MKQYRIADAGLARDQTEAGRGRIKQVFRYLQELHRLRTPPHVRLADRDWVLRLDRLPPSPNLQLGFRLDADGRIANGDGELAPFVLRVGRPTVTECPEPSVVLKNWLKPGYDDARTPQDELLKKSVKVRGGARQEFTDAEERVAAFESWCEERATWAAAALQAADAFQLFSRLFDLHSRFERESEKYQLFLADGILELEHEGIKVHHPLLLQRVELSFDPTVPEFLVVETGDPPEIHVPLLRCAGLDGHVIQELTDAVQNGRVHPLGGEATNAFLRDLAQRSWTNGQFVDDPERAGAATGPRITRAPHLLLGNRSHGLDDNLQRLLDKLDGAETLPTSLLRIVGIEAPRPARDGEPDLLFTKPANPEQIEVLRRLEETGAVLVQGPPGTGKSHTIANLIGHLLAQQKSILVTSHASKALRVVREKLPKDLQPLCVSVLQSDDESSRQLEESITGIVNQLAANSTKKLEKEIEKLQGQRRELAQQKQALHDQLQTAVLDEYREIELLGESMLPVDAAVMLRDGAGDDWIPGPLEVGAELPLDDVEVAQLYAAVAQLAPDVTEMARGELPDLAAFQNPKEFAALLDEVAQLEKAKVDARSDLWTGDDHDAAALPALLERSQAAVAPLRAADALTLLAATAGCSDAPPRTAWLGLCAQVEGDAAVIGELAPLLGEHTPDLGPDGAPGDLGAAARAVAEHLDAGGSLDELAAAADERLAALAAVTVDGEAPATAAHFWAVVGAVESRQRRAALGRSWDLLAGAAGVAWESLGVAPEVTALDFLPQIRTGLQWHDDVWLPAAQQLELQGLDWRRLLQKAGGTAPLPQRIMALVDSQLPVVLQQRHRQLRLIARNRERQQMQAQLDAAPKKGKVQGLLSRFRAGIKKGDYDAYADAWQELAQLHDARGVLAVADGLLSRLEPVAPGWVAALREQRRGHDGGKVPGDVKRAWRHRQWSTRLAAQQGVDLGKLQAQLDAVADELMVRTATYVEKSSWLAQLRRTGLQQQQALTGWLQLQKKIGKGTGKHVPLLKEEAKRTLSKCRSAVPVWIMPLSRVVESFDLATTHFDVVILDEASQCDVMGLLAFAIASEVVVVGDHEQVSPYAVGTSADQIRALIDELLPEIPNRQLYDGKTSVYDLAQQSFGGTIRLLEHFRCVPDIIRFSNELCYGGKIRPLREATSARVTPALVAHKVARGVEDNGINEREAQEIVALVAAMCRLDEYADCSIGVISMIGTDQALYIDSLLRSRLSITEYRRRQILCGNASQFQGDERDVILLSMVNSPNGHPLAMRQRDDVRKVFNVAASRARDQLWVVHSLDPGKDLKGGDLRLLLISHAESGGIAKEKTLATGRPADDTVAGRALCEHLTKAGYTLLHRFPIGDGEIELVVEGSSGRRVGVECIGDRALPQDEVQERLQRQLALRRLGWHFLRVRAIDIAADPARAFAALDQALQQAGIARPKARGKQKAKKPAVEQEPLQQKVLQRAAQIMSRWQVPSPGELLPGIRSEEAAPADDGDDAPPADDAAAPKAAKKRPRSEEP